ncbi:2-hydroxyglutaryl-CoA dehydratase D-component [Desulfatibacillum aliphaticivorans]|uniref:2-hydroxyglutaryl-CoA dehydratase D-component n=1 Tax=Desulfatibacillum aliphaticivorans TaxID=218208 RepID=B8FGK4_DESAL|nr:2-hydroxyacyl-CoA dehydratase family protein [Desulfatibacillum aliphaticivorans]ACL04913.1 2-hydroxyglutaryl-CoA dehydratase D-component [Desulfatibacillum aliphaticivorans]
MRLQDLKKADASWKDRAVHARYRVESIGSLARLLRHGPGKMAEIFRWDWLRTLAGASNLLDMAVYTRTGRYREASAYALAEVIGGIGDLIDSICAAPDRVVIHEDLVPSEIFRGMGLAPFMAEVIGIAVPLVKADWAEKYIDIAENEGTPPDTCSLPKCTMGVALDGQFPKSAAIVTSNMPCDGGMASYTILERELKSPCFRLDIPYNFYNDRAIDYFVSELKRMIAWLEEHTPGRMDWDRLKEVCIERNKAMEHELEIWELIRQKPAPMAGEAIWLAQLIHMVATPGSPRATRTMKNILKRTKKIMENGGGALPEERYRAVLWNPPTLVFPELFVWAEQQYGVALLADMLTYHRHPFIDVSSPDSMLRSLAQIIVEGPMARHTRGPAENFFDDLFYLYEYFSLDMIWMAGHIGCKNTMALNGMFRERCREREIPLFIMNYDLSDTRVVSPVDMKKQAEAFMETVMKAEPLL